ncbi:MAG: hypothetical protein ABIJ35_06355 [Acidobacteriota bacterium]
MFDLEEFLSERHHNFKKINPDYPSLFETIQPLQVAEKGSLIFINKPTEKTFDVLEKTVASVVLAEKQWGEENRKKLESFNKAFFLVRSPRLIITELLKHLYPEDDAVAPEGIHPSAQIHPEADIHSTVAIGQFCIIGKCRIGEGSVVGPFSVVKDNVTIGKNVTVREYCLLGGAGFGFERDDHAVPQRIPHIGSVVIEDNVEIFPYVNIDRGTLSETRIKKNTKIDHYCHIGHNTVIGENCIITAGTVFCGGCSIGDRTWTGVGSIVKQKVQVGNDVVLGLGAVVIKNVEDNQIVGGVPARLIRVIK